MEPLCGTKLSLARTYGQMWQVESISHLAEQGMKQASIFLKKKNTLSTKRTLEEGGTQEGLALIFFVRWLSLKSQPPTYIHVRT